MVDFNPPRSFYDPGCVKTPEPPKAGRNVFSDRSKSTSLRFFAVNILRLVPRAVELRRMQNEDEGDED
jgi:hypothetical protein